MKQVTMLEYNHICNNPYDQEKCKGTFTKDVSEGVYASKTCSHCRYVGKKLNVDRPENN